jgi:HK97 gp10 family phage protein
VRVHVRVEGGKAVAEAFGRFSAEVQRQASYAVVDAALAIQTQAKEDVPVDTGRLMNSISVAETEADVAAVSQSANQYHAPPPRIRDGMLGAVVGTNVEYAKQVEFGSSGRRAKPYLFPAFEQTHPRFYQRLRHILGDAVR